MAVVSGSQVLRELDEGLGALRNDLRSMDHAVADAGNSIREQGARALALYRKLAEIRLEQAESDGVISELDNVSRKTRDLLEERRRRHEALVADIRAAEEAQQTLEARREDAAREVETLTTVVDELEADVQERLDGDAPFAEQLKRAHAADAIADEAEAKTEDAVDDQVAKGKPYEADRLFMYLWDRGYGTSSYSANPLARMLDKWVAGLCGYDRARPNYWMLNEIPRRLRTHAERARAAADEEFEKLRQLEVDAAKAADLPERREALATARASLAAVDESIAEAEQRVAAMDEQRAAFAAGDDELMNRALETLARELQSDGVRALWRYATMTPDPDDDRIVAELSDVEERMDLLREEHSDRQKLYTRHVEKARELEKVRQKFKRSGFDDMRSVFENGPAVAGAVKQFLGGLLEDDDLWRIIARAHRLRRVRAAPDFGSGGFPRRSGTWQLPPFPRTRLPRRGGFGFPSPGRSRPRGGGGFSTGGGF